MSTDVEDDLLRQDDFARNNVAPQEVVLAVPDLRIDSGTSRLPMR